MAKKIVSFFDTVLKGSSAFSGLLVLATIAMTVYEVLSRYLFNEPTEWALDLGIFCLIWFSYASLAYVLKEGGHIAVDILVHSFAPSTRAVWDVITSAITFLFSLLLFFMSIPWVKHAATSGEVSAGMLRVPMWPVKIAVPIGIFLLIIVLLRNIIVKLQFLSTLPKPEKTEQHFPNLILLASVFFVLIVGSILLQKVSGAAGMVILMLTLLLFGVHVFSSLALTGIIGIFMSFGGVKGLIILPIVAFESLNNFALVCLPAFILVGLMLEKSGVGAELFDLCSKWSGGLPGGEGVATILACSIFAAISTSSAATAAVIGLMALPILEARKYNENFRYGLLCAGGTLGIMIPPSGTMILYSAVTEESLGKLFLAGVIPGLILSAMFITYGMVYCKWTGAYEKIPSCSWGERFQSLKSATWGLITPLIILGGIYTGIFTPLEAGAIAVLYAFLMILVRRKLGLKEMAELLVHTLKTSTMIMAVIVGALILGNFMTQMRVPNLLMEYVNSLGLPPWAVIFLIMVFLVILGCFLEAVSIIMITMPILYPLIISMGFDGIWFAVLITLNMEMAMITPPVGMNLYVVMNITKSPITRIVRGVVPFFFIMVVMMFIVYLFPSLSTWLPSAMISSK
jgi:C4-dicarboxylate transporter DctM subunit